MIITFLQSSLWLSGGGRVVVEYANRLSSRGHRVNIVIPKATISDELGQILNPAVNICEAAVTLVKPMSLVDQARLALSMVRAVPKSDVIVTTHTPTSVVSLVAGALMKRGTPIWFYMDYPGMFSDRPVEGWLLRHAIRWHKAALVLSSHSAQELDSQKKCSIVGLGLSDIEMLKPLPQEENSILNRERKAILYLGDFRPRKGLADFIKASELVYQKRKDIELWIALKEPGEIKTEVPFRKINRPSVPELANLYASCNLFVSASWFEGFGLPPLEAMACGAPVVVTDSGGVRDYAIDGENCLLVPPKNPKLMSDAILRILSDPTLEAQLRMNGPSAAQPFTWDKAADRFEQALLDALKS